MSRFRRYMHLERFGTSEVEGIELGRCYIFPKIDGTNASVWLEDGIPVVKKGSRNRELSIENDNAGFCKWANGMFDKVFDEHEHITLYGEWLVPHSLKTYKDTAWKRFYVFDVYDNKEERYLHFDEYEPIMKVNGIDYIPPIKIVKNATYDDFVFQLKNNVFQIEDGKGAGEGVVIKNYDFVNKYGRTTWAKIVTSEFKEVHTKAMGAPESVKKDLVEKEIADKYVTEALCEKVYAKIENDGGFRRGSIPRLLNTIYYDVIKEESWNFVKEFKKPTINFSTLQHFVFAAVKTKLPKVF